ncbi:Sporulation protein YabP [[Clostridium] ultunense Esp]|uniref:Sporulation protein YabP n=1 Tax=[Clostridium] ultunense Esp TaxID=1288971 RepID=M1ZGG3_9FIRM|nr:sporulation protein YabP [Schnuerera ultunensis]CCQ97333.1 Sporulation protein YabP [[Clostridium] ultunense Esp]SHD78393.1 Sporulation protein YabP [[Clostridium] ultunense Esp]
MTDIKGSFKNQNILVEDRNKVTITGVEQVESFNDNTIILKTIKGSMIIKGEELNVGKLNLDDGNIKIDGIINGINYMDKDLSQRGSIIGKIFK